MESRGDHVYMYVGYNTDCVLDAMRDGPAFLSHYPLRTCIAESLWHGYWIWLREVAAEELMDPPAHGNWFKSRTQASKRKGRILQRARNCGGDSR